MRALWAGLLSTLLCALVMLVTAPAASAGPYPPPATGHGSVSPSRVQAGGCVIFSGDGFAPGSVVVVRDDGTLVGRTIADRNGDFSFQVCFSASAKRGRHTLTGSGTSGSGQALTVSAVVIVEGARSTATTTGPQGAQAESQAASQAVSSGRGELAFTGFEAVGIVVLGLVLLGSGVGLLVTSRHSRRTRHRKAAPDLATS